MCRKQLILLCMLSVCCSLLFTACEGQGERKYKQEWDYLMHLVFGSHNESIPDGLTEYNVQTADSTLPVKFSHPPGFYKLPIELVITAAEGDIYYTLDGSMPTDNSARYEKPVTMDQPTVVRVRVKDGEQWLTGNATGTYLIGFLTSFPLISLSMDSGCLWDADTGIYSGMRGADSAVVAAGRENNFFRRIENPVHVEFFEQDGRRVIDQDAGIRLFGGLTRMFPEKSMRIIARKRYGDSRFRYHFFPDKDIGEFKSLVLRTSGNDYRSTRFRDAFITSLLTLFNIDVQASRHSILFVNGQYWGIYNIREKIDEHFLEANHGADPMQTDILQGSRTAEHGSSDMYVKMLHFLRNNDISKSENYIKLQEMMDVRNYTNFILTQIYISNLDARGNIRFWRAGNLDNRFRWILYDTDFGLGASMPASGNYLHECLSPVQTSWYNPEWSTYLLRTLVRNEEFRTQFIQQAGFMLSTVFHPDSMQTMLNRRTAILEPEIDRHLARNRQSKKHWYEQVGILRSFMEMRPGYMRSQFQSEFGIPGSFDLEVECVPSHSARFMVNGNLVEAGHRGAYFSDVPLEIEVVPAPLYVFDHWDHEPGNSQTVTSITGAQRPLRAHMRKRTESALRNAVIITEIHPTGNANNGGDWIEIANRSDEEVDLAGWMLCDMDHRFVIPNETRLLARGNLVVCCDTADFLTKYPGVESLICGNFMGGFSRQSEQFFLIDANGSMVDMVIFNRALYGNTLPDQYTVMLNPDADNNDMSRRWMLKEGFGTPGNADNGEDEPGGLNGLMRVLMLVFLMLWI